MLHRYDARCVQCCCAAGFMFAESVERLWYSLGETYICQPYFERPAYPGISLRYACFSFIAPILKMGAAMCTSSTNALSDALHPNAWLNLSFACREIVALKTNVREWSLTTYPENVYEHDVDEPAPGTNERR